jgi:hypothetical protein
MVAWWCVFKLLCTETLWYFCPRISCALVPLAWARFFLFSPNPTVSLLQPVFLACHFCMVKMEAQCFCEVLVSTDKTV